MSCNNCKSTCFDEPLGCLYHDGVSSGVVKQGDSQSSVNVALGAELERVAKLAESCTCGSILPSSTTSEYSEITSSIHCASSKTYTTSSEPFSVVTSPTRTGVDIQYNINSCVEDIDKIRVINSSIKIEGKKNGYDSIILSTDKLDNYFSLRPDNFPATLDIDIRVETDSGEKVYTQRVQLDPKGTTITSYLDSTTSAGYNVSNQKEVNELYDTKICSIENRLNSVYSSDLVARLTKAESTIASLQSILEDIGSLTVSYTDNCDNCNPGTITETLSEVLNKISENNCNTASTVQANTNNISTVKTQYATLPVFTGVTTTTVTDTTPTTPTEGTTVYVCRDKTITTGNCSTGICEETVKSCLEISVNNLLDGEVSYSTESACSSACGEDSPCTNVDRRIVGAEFVYNESNLTYTISYTNSSGISLSTVPNSQYSYTPNTLQTYTFVFSDGCEYTITDTAPNTTTVVDPVDACDGIDCQCDCQEGDCGFIVEGQFYSNRIQATEACRSEFGDNYTFSLTSCNCFEDTTTIDECDCGLTILNSFAEERGDGNTNVDISFSAGDCTYPLTINVAGTLQTVDTPTTIFNVTVPTSTQGYAYIITNDTCSNLAQGAIT